MQPVTPVIPGLELKEVVFAKDQPEYIPLPAAKLADGTVTTRWRVSFRERLRILFGGNLWVTQLTFNRPLQPIRIETEIPAEYESLLTKPCDRAA